VSTSSARRERVFLEERLTQVKADLEKAEVDLSHFSSTNATLDVKEQGKAMLQSAAQLQGELIAERSELEGLRQIYTDANPRVRAVRARIEELQQQLRKLGGQPSPATGESESPENDLYPSIRKLPVLGVAYADLYRDVVIQEAIFETLTKEYELAKVSEVKETPAVKVLDFAQVPEKKAFPPRAFVVLCGVVFALAAAVGWILAHEAWQKLDAESPIKLFAEEVIASVGHGATTISRDRKAFSTLTRMWPRGRPASALTSHTAPPSAVPLESSPEDRSDIEQAVGS
jgi:capsule polysaccharide export protein KpsE/RkpR